jgi:hypothetical protein
MPPKFDPNEITVITLRTFGGEAAGASALAPKVGPLGLVRLELSFPRCALSHALLVSPSSAINLGVVDGSVSALVSGWRKIFSLDARLASFA